jgi:hypothetical protein
MAVSSDSGNGSCGSTLNDKFIPVSFSPNRFLRLQVTDVKTDVKLNSVLDRSILL